MQIQFQQVHPLSIELRACPIRRQCVGGLPSPVFPVPSAVAWPPVGGWKYEEAVKTFEPYNRVQEINHEARAAERFTVRWNIRLSGPQCVQSWILFFEPPV
jgi:hypothetical protein